MLAPRVRRPRTAGKPYPAQSPTRTTAPGRATAAPAAPPLVARILPPRLALLAAGALFQLVSLVLWSAGSGASTSLGGFAAFALGTAALVAAAIVPAPLRSPAGAVRGTAYTAAAVLLLAGLAMGVLATVATAGDLLAHSALDPGAYVSDAAAFNHFDADLVVHGRNPYTADATYWDALRRFPASGATPLRRGRYAGSVWGPSLDQVQRDVRAEAGDPAQRGPEYDPATLHSYPALAFLAYVPLVWAGVPSTLPTSLILLIAFLAVVGLPLAALPVRQRFIGWALLLAGAMGVLLTLRGSFEVVALLPAILAWRLLDRPRLSPILLGLACAVKQLVWPLVPLYLVLVARRDGLRAAAVRGAIALVAFLVPNLPFAVLAPGAWARSLLLPMSLPLFPDGVGLVALARGGLLPLWPPAIYTALELIAVGALVVGFAFKRPLPRPELALLLGLLPLALAWRSQVGYFVWLPALALVAALPLLPRDLAGAEGRRDSQ